MLRWLILAPTKSIAEPFLQEATQAPQPMHSAASMASSATGLGTGMLLASGAEPVRTVMKPPDWMTLSNAERSTARSLRTGKARARHGSTVIVSPSRKLRMCSWQVVTPGSGPCGMPLMVIEHMPQMPSRQSWSKAKVSLPCLMSCSLSMSIISRNEAEVGTAASACSSKAPGWPRRWRQTRSLSARVVSFPFSWTMAVTCKSGWRVGSPRRRGTRRGGRGAGRRRSRPRRRRGRTARHRAWPRRRPGARCGSGRRTTPRG